MRWNQSSVLLATACLATVGSLFSSSVYAVQTLFRDQMTSGAAWTTLSSNGSDNFSTFGFDYSKIPNETDPANPGSGTNPASGIPEAPNSEVGDTATSGLMLVANFSDGLASSIAAYPTGMNFTGSYTFQFDMWLNTNGPFPAGGGGSTEFGGGSVAYDNASGTHLSGAGFNVSGEAGNSFDYRLYANGNRQDYDVHTGQSVPIGGINGDIPIISDIFDDKMVRQPNLINGALQPCASVGECGGDNADGNFYVEGIFSPMPPGSVDLNEGTVDPPIEQQNAFFDQFGPVKPGGVAFQWVTMKFTVDGDADTTFVQISSTDTGETADIATFNVTNTYDNNDAGKTPILTSFDGNISLILRDTFDSLPLPGNRRLNFGIFDNILVTAPDAGLAGDFDGNGTVDASDYTVWLDNLGSATALANDGGLGTPVGQAHYDLWKENFGNSIGTGTGNASNVPEPTTLLLSLLASVGLLVRRRR